DSRERAESVPDLISLRDFSLGGVSVHAHQGVGRGRGKTDQCSVAAHEHGFEDEGIAPSQGADAPLCGASLLDIVQGQINVERGVFDRDDVSDLGKRRNRSARVVAEVRLERQHWYVHRCGNCRVVVDDHLYRRGAQEGGYWGKNDQAFSASVDETL